MGAPPCIWTVLSSLRESGFFSTLVGPFGSGRIPHRETPLGCDRPPQIRERPAPPQPLAGKRFRLSITAKQALFGYAILLPTLAIILIFRFLPMLQAFYISLHEYDLIRPPRFIGLENFIDLLQDPLFLHSARISVAYVVFSCVPVWILSLALAVLFNREIRAKNLFRSAAFMPVVMPAVVNAVVWTFMYHQDGVVNTILGGSGSTRSPGCAAAAGRCGPSSSSASGVRPPTTW